FPATSTQHPSTPAPSTQQPSTQQPSTQHRLYESVCEKPASALIFALRAAFMLSGTQHPATQHRLYESV
ncbi:MAG: hypothetical protein V2I97_00100, partial [Desulfococcaceae bacterium]|nr:hypothetical protein [Desulfococcaceae bacterium]